MFDAVTGSRSGRNLLINPVSSELPPSTINDWFKQANDLIDSQSVLVNIKRIQHDQDDISQPPNAACRKLPGVPTLGSN